MCVFVRTRFLAGQNIFEKPLALKKEVATLTALRATGVFEGGDRQQGKKAVKKLVESC